MSQTVVAIKKGYYGGRVRYPKDVFEIADGAPLGGWMVLSGTSSVGGVITGDQPAYGVAIIPNEGTAPVVQVAYKTQHIGGGNFIVVDLLGDQIGPIIYRSSGDPAQANATAQRYVAQLNAGMAPDQVFP